MKAAGVILQSPDGLVLFLKRGPTSDHPGEWCLPAGRIEENETAEQAARRECREETNHIIGENLTEVHQTELFTTFTAIVSGAFVSVDETKEHVGFAWVSPLDPPQPLHPGVAETFKAWKPIEKVGSLIRLLEVKDGIGKVIEEINSV